MTSILASLATAAFINILLQTKYKNLINKLPHFDCRVFQLPNQDEAANAILWREQDAAKNAISMAASLFYSHKQLHKKNSYEKQEMLFAKGINFNDYPAHFKRGTFVRRETVWREFTELELAKIPEIHRPESGIKIQRSRIVNIDMSKFSSVSNRVDVIFNNAKPELYD